MTWSQWKHEGKITIDFRNPMVMYLHHLGADCQAGTYAYKIQRRENCLHQYRVLVKPLSQFGGSDYPHLIFSVNLKAKPPIQVWHHTKAKLTHIGSLKSLLLSLVLGTLLESPDFLPFPEQPMDGGYWKHQLN